MPTISEAFATATQHHRAGRLQVAAQMYGQVLAAEPNHAQACHLLGVLYAQAGNYPIAIEYISRALKVNPDWPDALANLGGALRETGRLDESVTALRRALQLKPDFALAHNNLGNNLRDKGNLEAAIASFRRAVKLQPNYAPAHYNLGLSLNDQKNLTEAAACYRRALKLQPDFALAHNNLGNVLREQGKLDEAILSYRQSVALKPDYAEAHSNLGVALRDLGCLDEAADCFSRAVRTKPDFAEGHGNLGSVLGEQGKLEEAASCLRRALVLKPNYPDAHNDLGAVLNRQGKLDEAVGCHRRALELKPDFPAALVALVHALQQLCDWTELPVLAERVIDLVDREPAGEIASTVSPFSVSPFSFLALPRQTTAEQKLRCARQWVACQLPATPGQASGPVRRPAREPRSKLTIGYLSADFRAHPVAALIAEMIEKHDRDRFVINGYSSGPDDQSSMRRRLIQAFDRFVDIKNASFKDSAQRIADDGVDILVDLTGYTQDGRPQVLAMRPAPIQVNYLGFSGTMGAPFMDYILVDDFIVPSDQQAFFTEKLVHLPGCFMANDSQREISPHSPSRAECGLPEQGFVFCSFNNSFKITPAMFDVWMELLKGIPGSVLWLQAVNRFVPPNLSREAQSRGVAAERLVFAPRTAGLPDHLARYRLADLFLDSFPFNAHATASDALWVGCPLLTLAGETFESRVAGSLLRTLGLSELVTTSIEVYQSLALQLARNPRMLGELRARLAANRQTSGLFSGERFARTVERAYLTMWETHASGEQPRGFVVNST